MKTSLSSSVLDNLLRGWRLISQLGNTRNLKLRPSLPDSDLKLLRTQMHECLESRGGEVTARSRAAVLGQAYLELDDEGRYRFLKLMIEDYGIDEAELKSTAERYLDQQDDIARGELLARMQSLLRPPRVKLLTQFNALPSGVQFLVSMRADLLRFSRERPGLEALDNDLKQLLVSWFDIGFLDLKRITWDEPASLLEKLIAYEAVHEIRSWDDLKHRLNIDRRCYSFFHPRMPDEPLILVQVALTKSMVGNIRDVLDRADVAEDIEAADTAIFYSISNTQSGLRGISFGDFLIKRVVNDLSTQLPNLKTFATLSPVPGFRKYVIGLLQLGDNDLISPAESKALLSIVSGNSGKWYEDSDLTDIVKPALMRLCAHYLLNEKRGNSAINTVAGFHLTNGARVERINWLGDSSDHGLENSLGMMVNYLYKLSRIERNHEGYVGQGKIASSSAVRSLLK